MALKKKVLLIIYLFFFSSCSTNTDFDKLSKIFDLYKNQNKIVEIKTFSRKDLDGINYPLIEVKTNGILLQSLMLPLSIRDNYLNYSSGSGQSLTMKGGLILRTNGLETGLISLDVMQRPLLQKTPILDWPLKQTKKYSFLKPDFSTYSIVFQCEFIIMKKENIVIVEKNYILTEVQDVCKSKNHTFSNTYWVDDTGFIWKSSQWISPKNVKALVTIFNPYLENDY